jgi:hypothetical protein
MLQSSSLDIRKIFMMLSAQQVQYDGVIAAIARPAVPSKQGCFSTPESTVQVTAFTSVTMHS